MHTYCARERVSEHDVWTERGAPCTLTRTHCINSGTVCYAVAQAHTKRERLCIASVTRSSPLVTPHPTYDHFRRKKDVYVCVRKYASCYLFHLFASPFDCGSGGDGHRFESLSFTVHCVRVCVRARALLHIKTTTATCTR